MAKLNELDLESLHLQIIRDFLKIYLPNKTVWVYGSRIKGTATKRSDLDLVVFGTSNREISEASEAFSESTLPFIVQILNWEEIPACFKENIKENYLVLASNSSP